MPITCQKVIALVEKLIPLQLAEEWDNIGLQMGDPRDKVEGILLALDFNLAVAQEAARLKANFVLVHHAPIFKPMKRIDASRPDGQLVLTAIRQGLNVYAAHTNLDMVEGGVNDQLALTMGIQDIEILAAPVHDKNYKLAVFVPETHVEKVQRALGDAGAGFIGNYSHCSFRTPGIGSFLPGDGANPYLGQVGQIENAAEYRLETIVPENILPSVLQAMFDAHPYEEVAYDLYPLANETKAKNGLGRVGNLPSSMTLEEFIPLVKERLAIDKVKVAIGHDGPIKRVAVCGGSGGRLINRAAAQGAQVLITGDISYHEGQFAQSLGLTVIDAGHGPTETVVLPWLAKELTQELAENNVDTPVLISQINTDPWGYY